MMMRCERHGLQTGREVSPDLGNLSALDPVATQIFKITFVCGEMDTHWFFLSKEFADENGLVNGLKVEIPDKFPAWMNELKVVCNGCFSEHFGNRSWE